MLGNGNAIRRTGIRDGKSKDTTLGFGFGNWRGEIQQALGRDLRDNATGTGHGHGYAQRARGAKETVLGFFDSAFIIIRMQRKRERKKSYRLRCFFGGFWALLVDMEGRACRAGRAGLGWAREWAWDGWDLE